MGKQIINMKNIFLVFFITISISLSAQNTNRDSVLGIEIIKIPVQCNISKIKLPVCECINPQIDFWNTTDNDYPIFSYDSVINIYFEQAFNDSLVILVDDSVYYCNYIKTNKSTSFINKVFKVVNQNSNLSPKVEFVLLNKIECVRFKLLYGYRYVYIQRSFDAKWYIEFSNNLKSYH
jgi:hypothetical protein